jgi:hypothetical protein
MPDMNFLNDLPDAGPEPKKDGAPKPSPEDLSFHVPPPPPTPPKPPAPPPKPQPPKQPPAKNAEDLLTPKVPTAKLSEPVLPTVAPAPPQIPTIAMPKAVPKASIAPGQKPNGAGATPPPTSRDTLHVSLISAGGGIGLSELTVRDRVRRLILCAIIAIILDGCMFGGLMWYSSVIKKQVAIAEASMQQLDADIAKAESDAKAAKDLQTLLKSADAALRNHLYWTRVLAMIEELAKPQVVFAGATIGSEGSFSSSITAPDYLTLAQQILVLRNDPRVKSVPFSGASKSGGGVTTAISVSFDPSVMLNDATSTSPH